MWNKQQVAVVISFIVTNCFIQISCNITSNHTSSAELIDNIAVDDWNNKSSSHNNDKSDAYIEDLFSSGLSNADDRSEESFECHCDSTDQDCYRQCLGEDDLSSLSNMFLLTAGEVLLGCAIIMGLSALVTMVLRVCSRSRMARNRRENPDFIDALARNDNRASLTSLQQAVVAKMRDRPPRYETRHNYEYRRRDGDEPCCDAVTPSIRNVEVLNPGASSRNGPPPSYDTGDTNSVHELPPAYTISLSTDDCCRNDANQNECVGGISNQSFTCDGNQQCQDNNSCRSSSANNVICSDRNCDNILYI